MQEENQFTWKQLQAMAQRGELTKRTCVLRDGLADWSAAEALPELSQFFGGTPMPPPPPGVMYSIQSADQIQKPSSALLSGGGIKTGGGIKCGGGIKTGGGL